MFGCVWRHRHTDVCRSHTQPNGKISRFYLESVLAWGFFASLCYGGYIIGEAINKKIESVAQIIITQTIAILD